LKQISVILFILISITSISQSHQADSLIFKGVEAHEKMQYIIALTYFDSALNMNGKNNLALIEKAITLDALGELDESKDLCEKAIEIEPNIEEEYITYGNVLDKIGKTRQSIEVYDQGLEIFPSSVGLLYNKGIALIRKKKLIEAETYFQKVLMVDINHYNSYRAIAAINYDKNMALSLLCYMKLNIEYPNSEFAEENYSRVQEIHHRWVVQENNETTIYIPKKIIKSSYKRITYGITYENNFEFILLAIAEGGALEYNPSYDLLNIAELTEIRLRLICSFLTKDRDNEYGFYWELLGNYFISLAKSDNTEAASYLFCLWSIDTEVNEWVMNNKEKIQRFNDWISISNSDFSTFMKDKNGGSIPPRD